MRCDLFGTSLYPDWLTNSVWLTLAQSRTTLKDVSDVWFWLGVIVVAAVVLVVIGVIVKKIFQPDDTPVVSSAFTLSDLREMHAQGQLTDEEFTRAKAVMVARSKAAMQSDEDDEVIIRDIPDEDDEDEVTDEPPDDGPESPRS